MFLFIVYTMHVCNKSEQETRCVCKTQMPWRNTMSKSGKISNPTFWTPTSPGACDVSVVWITLIDWLIYLFGKTMSTSLSLPVWRRTSLKKGTPRDLFWPRSGSIPGQIWPINNRRCSSALSSSDLGLYTVYIYIRTDKFCLVVQWLGTACKLQEEGGGHLVV